MGKYREGKICGAKFREGIFIRGNLWQINLGRVNFGRVNLGRVNLGKVDLGRVIEVSGKNQVLNMDRFIDDGKFKECKLREGKIR